MSINKMDKANNSGYFNFLLKIDNMLATATSKHIIIGNFTSFLKGQKYINTFHRAKKRYPARAQ
jgi:hypothetical protein